MGYVLTIIYHCFQDVGLYGYTLPILGQQRKLQCATYIKSFKLPNLFIFNKFLFFYHTFFHQLHIILIVLAIFTYIYIYIYIEEALLRVKEQRNILHEISKRKAKWVVYILRRNSLLQQVIEGKIKGGIEVTGRRRRRRRKLLDDLKERRGYFHLKEEALNRTMWRTRFGRGFGHVVMRTTK